MRLIQNHVAHTREGGVLLQPAKDDAGGAEEEARARGAGGALVPNRVADGEPDL